MRPLRDVRDLRRVYAADCLLTSPQTERSRRLATTTPPLWLVLDRSVAFNDMGKETGSLSSTEEEVPAPAGPAVGEEHAAKEHGALAHATRLMRHSVELFEEVLAGKGVLVQS